MNVLLYLLLLFLLCPVFAKEEVCSEVVIHGKDKINLSDTEKRLVCGDKEQSSYQKIPPYQATYFMTGFLQSRGYLRPKFKTIDGILHVYIGKKAYLKKVRVKSEITREKEYVHQEIKRRYKGKELTPDLLNKVEKEARSILRQRGYPCVNIETESDASKNDLGITLLKTTRHTFGTLEKEKIKGLRANALDRYYPFGGDDQFDEGLLALNEKRLLRAEVVQGTYYLEDCSENAQDFSLSQKFLVGPPRTIRFGVGASTELGPMARVSWNHNRSGSMASTISARILGSFRSQTFALMADTFIWKDVPRRSVLSEFNLTRESQIDYEQTLLRLMPASIKWTRDAGERGWTWILGPTLESGTYHSKDNTNTKSFNTVALEGSYNLMAHTYELFDVHPEEGDQLNFTFGFRHPALGFSHPSLKLDSSYVKLRRLSEMKRGFFVGGVRVSAGTLLISDDASRTGLPPAVKFYGGGSDDIRGFLLNTLPENNGEGAITRTSLKLELRRTYFLLESLEYFLFVDGAYFGDKSLSTTSELFYSPGLGLRWHSPIGLVQGYVARALTLSPNDDGGHFFYAGLGGVF